MLRVAARSAFAALFVFGCFPKPDEAPEDVEAIPVTCDGVGAALSAAELYDQVVHVRCITCHKTGGQAESISHMTLESLAEFQSVVGKSSIYAQGGGLKVVDPSNPQNSSMVLKLFGGSPRYRGPNGEHVGSKMPATGMLAEEEREKFRAWVCAGAN